MDLVRNVMRQFRWGCYYSEALEVCNEEPDEGSRKILNKTPEIEKPDRISES